MEDEKRNLNPHKSARAAMWLYSNQYAASGKESMDFWDGLPVDKTSQDHAKDIRAHCMKCCSGDIKYIAECPSKLCPVYPFRLSGYKTDLTSLIPVKEVEILPEYEGGIVDLEAKITV